MTTLSQVTFPATRSHLHQFIESVVGSAKEQAFGDQKIGLIRLAVEEALVNVFKYAYPKAAGDVVLRCLLDDRERFIIEIEDSGAPFNVLTVSEPILAVPLSERKIGGLGIHLIRQFTDEVEYRRDGGKNLLRLIVGKASEKSSLPS